jgi:cytochrome c oxidase subunit 2
MFSGPSKYAGDVDYIMFLIVGVSVLLLVGITIAMIYFVIRYSRKKNPKASQIEGSATLETIWIILPTALVLAMFYYGYSGFRTFRTIPENSQIVHVTGRMWSWNFKYENGKQSDTLYVPLSTPTKLILTTADVNHSLFIPAFRIKEDALAGKENYMVVNPDKTGSYDIACAEYCGMNHSYMYTKLVVLPDEEYKKWLEKKDGRVDSTKTAAIDDSAKVVSVSGQQ